MYVLKWFICAASATKSENKRNRHEDNLNGVGPSQNEQMVEVPCPAACVEAI